MWQTYVNARADELGMKQKQLAAFLGIPYKRFNHYMTGRTPIPLLGAVEIFEKLGLNPALITIDDVSYIVTDPQERKLLDKLRAMSQEKRDSLGKLIDIDEE